MAKNCRIIFPCRVAYEHCWRPSAQFGGAAKYSMTALIPKEETEVIRAITEAIEESKNGSADRFGGRIPPDIHSPLRDGDVDKPNNPAFRNMFYLNLKSTDPPQIVDRDVKPIMNQSEFYSGVYANVSVIFFAYNYGGAARGIGCRLQNIQKTDDGPVISGRITACEEFKPLPPINSDFLR